MEPEVREKYLGVNCLNVFCVSNRNILTLKINPNHMASVRSLKKDIDMVMSMALSDCFYVLEYNEKVNQEEIMKIASDIVIMHRELRLRANHPDGKDNPKLVKQYYQKVVSDLLSFTDVSLERLSAEVKKVV